MKSPHRFIPGGHQVTKFGELLDRVARWHRVLQQKDSATDDRELLARVLGLSRPSVYRYTLKDEEPWITYALLGSMVAGGDLEVARATIEHGLELAGGHGR